MIRQKVSLTLFFLPIFLWGVLVSPQTSLFADVAEDQYFQTQEEQIHVKEARTQDLTYKIESLQQQINREREEIKNSNQKIWREFSDTMDVERRELQEKLNSLSQRQTLFETELDRKRGQDEIRLREKEAELKTLMMDADRFRKELDTDKRSLEDLRTSYETRKKQQKIDRAPLPDGTEILQNGAVQVTKASGMALLGKQAFSTRDILPEYHLSIGDVLNIEVWRNPDLSKRTAVRPDGRVSLPLAGDVEVVGLSLVELRQVLTDKLADYVRDPQVTISLEGFGGRKFVILGEVQNPGVYRYQEAISLVEAIGLAGGFTKEARTGKVMIVRGDIHKTPQVKVIGVNAANILKKGMISENLDILPNDILYVGRDFLGDYNDFLDSVVDPSLTSAVNFFVLRSAIRTAQDKRN